MTDAFSARTSLGDFAAVTRTDNGATLDVNASRALDGPQMRSLAALLLETADRLDVATLSQAERGLALAEVHTEATRGLRHPEQLRVIASALLLLSAEEASIAHELAASILDGEETETLAAHEFALSEVAGLLEMEQDETAAYLRDRAEAHERLRGLLPGDED